MTPGGRGARGQASLELALVLPLILGLLLFAVQLGLIVRDQVLTVHAAREGARAAAVDPTATTATIAATDASSLDRNRMIVTLRRHGRAPELVEVTVTYRSQTAVPIVGPLLGDITISESVTMRVEDP